MGLMLEALKRIEARRPPTADAWALSTGGVVAAESVDDAWATSTDDVVTEESRAAASVAAASALWIAPPERVAIAEVFAPVAVEDRTETGREEPPHRSPDDQPARANAEIALDKLQAKSTGCEEAATEEISAIAVEPDAALPCESAVESDLLAIPHAIAITWPAPPSEAHRSACRDLAARIAPFFQSVPTLALLGIPGSEAAALAVGLAPELAERLGGRLLVIDQSAGAELAKELTAAAPAADQFMPAGECAAAPDGGVRSTSHAAIDFAASLDAPLPSLHQDSPQGGVADDYRAVLVYADAEDAAARRLAYGCDRAVLAVCLEVTTARMIRRYAQALRRTGLAVLGSVAVDGRE